MNPLQKYTGLTLYLTFTILSILYTALLFLLQKTYDLEDLALLLMVMFVLGVISRKIDWRKSPRLEVLFLLLGITSYSFPPLFSLILSQNHLIYNIVGMTIPYLASGYLYVKTFGTLER